MGTGRSLVRPPAGGRVVRTWTPAIPSAGSWRILVRWPASSGNTAAARYTVTHAGGTTVITLNQMLIPEQAAH